MIYSVMMIGIDIKNIFIFLVILFLAGCEKQKSGYSELIMNVPEKWQTKTHLKPGVPNHLFYVIWDEGDQVKVFDRDGGEGIYTNTNIYEDNNHDVAYFGGEGVDITSTVNVFYPVSIAISSNEFTLPREQTYRAKNNGYMFNYPMWAQETNNNHIWFRNLTGILILRIRGKQGTLVRNVYVKEPSDPIGSPLRGTFSVTAKGSTHTNETTVTNVSPVRDIMLNCESAPTTLSENESSLFYLSVPEGSHGRLIIGLDYKLPSSENWKTTYQVIYAQSYGGQRFNFHRSEWTPIDVDFSELDSSLIYSILNVSLNPNQVYDTVVNTDMPLTTEFNEYTFAIDITPGDIISKDGGGHYRKTIYSEMDNVDYGYKGIIIRLGKRNDRGNTLFEVNVGTSTSLFSSVPITSEQRHQFVVTIENYTGTYGRVRIYFMRNGMVTYVTTTFRKTEWVTSDNPMPEVGGDQHISGRYFDGTIHSFKIYDRVWKTQEINNFIQQ